MRKTCNQSTLRPTPKGCVGPHGDGAEPGGGRSAKPVIGRGLLADLATPWVRHQGAQTIFGFPALRRHVQICALDINSCCKLPLCGVILSGAPSCCRDFER